MDPATLLAAAIPMRATLPELARVMAKWIAQTANQSVKLNVVGRHGVEVVDLTPENAEALLGTLKTKALRETVGITINGGTGIQINARGTPQAGVDAEPDTPDAPDTPEAPDTLDAYPETERLDPESLKISLVQETLARMHSQLVVELPGARSRERLVKRVSLSGSLAALISNVGVLGSLGFGNATASIVAAVIALLVSGLKIVENHLIAGVTGKEPHRLQAMVIESTRLSYEAAEILNIFRRLNAARAAARAESDHSGS